MKNLIVAVILALLPATARAASFTCETVSGPLGLCIPKINTDWPSWSSATVNTFRLLGAGAPVNSTTTVTTAATFQTRRISGVSTGTPNIWISSPTIVSITTQPYPSGFIFVSSGSVLIQSTGSIAGQSILEIRKQNGGPAWKVNQAGDVVSTGSSTASAFYGDGSNLTNLPTATEANTYGAGGSSKTFVGPVLFSSATYGAWVEIASASVSGVTSYTFSNVEFTTAAARKLEWKYLQNTSNGHTQVSVNGFAANYDWTNKLVCRNTEETQTNSSSDSSIRVNGNNPIPAGQQYEGEATITKFYPTGVTFVRYQGFLANTTISCESHGGGYIAVTTNSTNEIKFATSAGTMTGIFKLYMRWDK